MRPLELNSAQAEAAGCLDRPVLVTAGAGSGKTRMLTRRFLNAVVPGAIPGWPAADVDQVLAITFTEKAAAEIGERIRDELLSAGETARARALHDAWISTIHGLCSRLLRSHALEAGVDPLFSVGDQAKTSRLEEAAFERAATRFVEAEEAGAALFDAYPYDAVFRSCLLIAKTLKARGLPPEAVELEPADTLQTLLSEAADLFSAGTGTRALPYAGTSAEPGDHADRCEMHLSRCAQIDPGGEECAEELLALLCEYTPLRGRLKGIEREAEELKVRRELVIGRLVAAMTAGHAKALRELVRSFVEEHASMKAEAGLVDFDDLQIDALRLLETHPEIAETYRRHFRAVMVDEFQDTDLTQLRIVEALSDGNLCTVGDESQSIYRFRGADVDVYREHRRRMKEARALISELSVNYRSRSAILAFVNAAFGSDQYFGRDSEGFLPLSCPPDAASRPGLVRDGDGPAVEIALVDSTDARGGRVARETEARLLAERLRELAEAGVRAEDMVVLVRRYAHAHVYAEAIRREGMAAAIVGGSRFFALPETAVMRALVRVLADPGDDTALGVLLASEFSLLSANAMVRLRHCGGDRGNRALWDALSEGREQLDGTDRVLADRLVGVIASARARLGKLPLEDVLLLAIEEAGWDLRLLSRGDEGRDAYANVMKFVRLTAEYESARGEGPAGLTRHFDSAEALRVAEPAASLAGKNSPAVRIMSVHAAKGLEFPVVAVPDLGAPGTSGSAMVRVSADADSLRIAMRLPSGSGHGPAVRSAWFAEFSAEDTAAELAEDDRVLYVAMTRAQDRLLLSGAMGLRPKKPSTARHHLAKLARVVGLETPVQGECDTVFDVGEGAECRVRVTDAMCESVTKPRHHTAFPIQGGGIPCGLGDAQDDPHAVVVRPPSVAPEPRRQHLPDRLSYTQLAEFEWCPLLFWVRRVLGVAFEPSRDGGQGGPIAFGSALHLALSAADGDGGPSEAELHRAARRHGLPAEQDGRLRETVQRFCHSELSATAWAGEVVRKEVPFAFAVEDLFMLRGALDLYSRTGDAGLVIDYKSGTAGADDGEAEERYQLQAECYALAALKDGCTRVRVVFARLECATLEGGFETVSFSYEASDAEVIERKLGSVYRAIEQSAFAPAPTSRCGQCEVPSSLCADRPAEV